VTTRAETVPVPAPEFGEKEFYLDEFHAHTLCFAVALRDCERAGGFESLGRVLRELIANETRVILLLGVEDGREASAELARVRRRLQRLVLTEETARRFPAVRGRRSTADSFVDLSRRSIGGDDLAVSLTTSWLILRRQPLLVGLVEEPRLIDLAQRVAGRLRVHKLVLVERDGGVTSATGDPLSFMDEAMLTAVLQPGQAEWAGLAGRRAVLDAIRAALRGGAHAVNLCTLDGLARELYTYEGSGTLFTREDYCRIERLGIDDFVEVERLIARGQREGYLKPRSAVEIARILINGFGAEIGSHHFAGVCGLEVDAYRTERVAEIVGLYTITRFKGEGVGGRLVTRALAEARELGLRYVFACTVDERVQAFFERQGFARVTADDVPAAKWRDYEPQRRARLRVLRYDLEPEPPHD
jgi:N-acetylglutamate synthase-like GNAT family acetyltransferase